ncbi:MAG: hypothetical protein JXA42_18410 [Anaerolineales bacterium]|nr:hypothetical protein [Anaerolineales bacterium]
MRVEVPEKLAALLNAGLGRKEELVYVHCNARGDQALIITTLRFLCISWGALKKPVMLSEIVYADVTTVPIPGRRREDVAPGFELMLRGKKNKVPFISDPFVLGRPLDESFAHFPRKLCEVINIPFAPFKLLPAEGFEEGFILDFFGGNLQKNTIRSLKKCAGCQQPVDRPFVDKINIAWGGLCAYIPYCSTCYKQRFRHNKKMQAVRSLPRAAALRDRIWFEQLGYAREFAELNLEEQTPGKIKR